MTTEMVDDVEIWGCFPVATAELHIARSRRLRLSGPPWFIKLTAQVQVRDQDGLPVPGALIAGEWSLDGVWQADAVSFYGATDALGRDKFQYRGAFAPGLWQFCVTDITHPDPAYAPWPPGGYPGDPDPCLELVVGP